MNIVSLIMQYLGPMIVGKLASSLGINSTVAQKLIAAALPTILAALVGRASQPGGAQAIADAISKQDGGLLGNLGNLIGGAQQAQTTEAGLGTLGSLLGSGGLGALTGALGKFGGVDDKASKGLLGMLAPVALGTIGQQQKSQGLDVAGLASMLMGQKSNIQAAMPADFSKLLGGSGLLDSLGSVAAAASTPAARPAAPSVAAETYRPTAAPGRPMWQWLALAGAAALAAWYMFGTGTPKQVALPTAPKVMAGTTDIGTQLGTSLGSLQAALGTIKDKSSAEAALPRLRSAQSDIDRIAGQFGALNADSKRSMAGYVGQALPLLLPIINKLLGDTAIGPLLKPVLDGIVARMQTMSKA